MADNSSQSPIAPHARTSDTLSYSNPWNNIRPVTLFAHFHSAATLKLSARGALLGSLQESSVQFSCTRAFSLIEQVQRCSGYIIEGRSRILFLVLSSFVCRCRLYGYFSFREGKSWDIVESVVWGTCEFFSDLRLHI